MQAEASLKQVPERFPGQPVVAGIRDASRLWPVEENHKDYYLKNPLRYRYCRWNCGPDARLDPIRGDYAREGAGGEGAH